MAEPLTTTVATGILIGAAASAPLVLLGAHGDALGVGMISAILVSIMLPTVDTLLKSAASVCLASLFAGYISPAAATYIVALVPSLLPAAETLRMAGAMLIGTAAPHMIPGLINRAKKLGEGP